VPDVRAFLDANVLFSAAYREGAGLRALWRLPDVSLWTSGYAIEEARRNLDGVEPRIRLDALVGGVQVVAESASVRLSRSLKLADKDRPILEAAIAARATHLLTGDLHDFGHLFGRRVAGVLVLTPAAFLKGRAGR
jgi:predicted nucleic acid-binding protein